MISNKATITILFLIASTLSIAQHSFEKKFQALLDSVYDKNEESVGILIHVESPDKNISWTAAKGFSNLENRQKLMPTQPVLVASNTKTYVAAAILRLVEMNKLTLDGPIGPVLHQKTSSVLTQAGYDLNSITVKHLLSHTSGIIDYVDKEYFNFMTKNQQYSWTRDEQIALAASKGKPKTKPGNGFEYADINYLLLTEIIENKTQLPFYSAIAELLKYKRLGLASTWFKSLDQPIKPTPPMAHQYANSYTLDSYNINPSWDLFGGGGMASSAKDAALFYYNLFTGKIVSDSTILSRMWQYVLPSEQSKYCLGIFHFNFGYDLYYHGGWWGTDVNYSPNTNTAISVFTLNRDAREAVNPILGKRIHSLLLKD